MPFAFEDVTVAGDGRPRLDHVTTRVADAGVTAISGPSGAGKSTLLRLGNRLIAPDAGVVRFRGEDLAGLTPDQVLAHRRRVGMVFQRPVVFAGTVLVWLLNAFASVIRGTGNMLLPALTICLGGALGSG